VSVVARRAGFDPDEVTDAVNRPEVKGALRAATDEAVALGVFGVPSVRVGNTVFWGDDRLEDAVASARAGR